MSLIEHLTELRRCLAISLIAVSASFTASFYFSEQLLKLLTGLITSEKRPTFVFLSPAEALWSNFKVALFAGIILALPVVLYQIWRFVSPGLSEKERRYGILFLILVIISFGIGLLFCYFVVLRFAMNFLLSYKTADLTPMISIGYYLDFVIKFMLAFGIIFELPFIIIFLTRIGLFTPEFLAKNRKYAILLNFIIAAVLTPTPDVFNQLLMAGPLIVLYEIGIIGAKLLRKKEEV
jgi:sec-independent protein translocase protein TatC